MEASFVENHGPANTQHGSAWLVDVLLVFVICSSIIKTSGWDGPGFLFKKPICEACNARGII